MRSLLERFAGLSDMLIYLALGGGFVQLRSPSVQQRRAGVGQGTREVIVARRENNGNQVRHSTC